MSNGWLACVHCMQRVEDAWGAVPGGGLLRLQLLLCAPL